MRVARAQVQFLTPFFFLPPGNCFVPDSIRDGPLTQVSFDLFYALSNPVSHSPDDALRSFLESFDIASPSATVWCFQAPLTKLAVGGLFVTFSYKWDCCGKFFALIEATLFFRLLS